MTIINSISGGNTMENKSVFSNRLKVLRKASKMTQLDLAEKLGIVRTAVTNYETGRALPDPNTLNTIAEIFSVTTDYLLGRDDNILTGEHKNTCDTYIPYDDLINYIDSHLSELPEDQLEYFVKQVNEIYWSTKNINIKNYSSRNKKNNQ